MLSRFNALVRNVPVVAACPHPGAVLRRDWHLFFGAETTPLSAYLLGLVLIQTALTTSVTVAVRRHGVSALAMSPRLVGAAVAGIGLAVLGAQILPA